MARLRAALRRTLRRRDAREPDHTPGPDPRPAGQVSLDLAGLSDETLTALAHALMTAATSAGDESAARLLHGAAREVYDVAVTRAEKRVVDAAERMLQIRVWRSPESDGDVGGG